MLRIAIYLRKSREDEKLERELGKGETLSLHRKDLLKIAKSRNYNIVKIYEELVSGESLLYRPEMLSLLKEVEKGEYAGVLCMDLQRLGRGDMEEQGLILKAFKKSNTKIITPEKVYDLDNEFDEEYSEFEAFMSRKEYKMINKRLRRGVLRSVESGNYNGAYRPFGYNIITLKNGRSLEISPDESKIVKLIYDLYNNDYIGSQIISEKLNDMGVKTVRGNAWTAHAVADILKNPVYYGKIAYFRRYGYRTSTKKKSAKNRDASEWLIVDGKHEPIISEDEYKKAMQTMKSRNKSPVKPSLDFVNPLAGLIICGICGSKMTYRSYKKAGVDSHIICKNKCGNKSAKFKYIEKDILNGLSKILESLKIESLENNPLKATNSKETELTAYKKELSEVLKQRANAYDFLEKGIYNVPVFTERINLLADKIENLNIKINAVQIEIKKTKDSTNINKKIRRIQNILDAYTQGTPAQKNAYLKTVIEKAVYVKDKKAREDNFEIQLYTLL